MPPTHKSPPLWMELGPLLGTPPLVGAEGEDFTEQETHSTPCGTPSRSRAQPLPGS